MRYRVYKTTNKVNGRDDIGKHQTEDPNDSYLGSGRALLSAVNKYGRDAFEKTVLFDFDNEADMNLKEKELVTEDLVSDPMSYNMGVGGEGRPMFRGRLHTEETKSKISRSVSGKVPSIETRRKIGEANRNRIITDDFRQRMREVATGRKKTEEERRRISESMRRRAGAPSCLISKTS